MFKVRQIQRTLVIKQTLWIANSEGVKAKRVLTISGSISQQLDVSTDNKVVFVKIQTHPEIKGLFQHKLMTFDINSKKLFGVPLDFGTSCKYGKWAANSHLVVYETQTCHFVPGGSIEVISEDGQFHEKIYSSTCDIYRRGGTRRFQARL